MSRILSITVLTTALFGLVYTNQSQALPASFPSKSTLYSQLTEPKPSVANTPDLTLLSKAVGTFWQTDRAETESQMTISVAEKGIDLKIYARVKTIVQTGDKFQTQLEFALPGSKTKVAYTIISDGRKVWTYRPDLRQYSETTPSKFKNGSNSMWIGVSSFFFISLNETQRQEMISSLGTDRDLIKAMPPANLKDLIGMSREVDGQKLYTYAYEINADKIKFVFFVDPTSTATKKIEFNADAQGVNVNFDEKILNRNNQVKIDPQIFKFSPPKGTKKVRNLKIEPFSS